MRADTGIQWRAYPALGLALSFGLGIAAAYHLPGLPFAVWLSGLVFGALLAIGSSLYARRRLVSLDPLLRTLAVLLVVFSLGGLRYLPSRSLPARHVAHAIYNQTEKPASVSLVARVAGRPRVRPPSVRFPVEAIAVLTGSDTVYTEGLVLVTLARPRHGPPPSYPSVQRGDVLRLAGVLQPTPPRRNPADFDYGGYLHRQGIYVTLTLYEPSEIVVLEPQASGFERALTAVQDYVAAQLHLFIPGASSRAIVQALILGDRDALDAESKGWFANTGLMHLLAVSGLHVLMVGMILYGVLRPLLLRAGCSWRAMEVVRAALTMCVLLLYLFVTGASASVIRAVVMTGLLIGGHLLQRSSHVLNTLGIAGLALLLIRPTYLFDVGFQLSFAAVAAIVTLHPVCYERLPEVWRDSVAGRHLVGATSVSLAATLGTMPVLLFHFGRVSFAGLLLNLPAIPLTGFALAAGLLTVVFGGWLPLAAGLFGAAADVLAQVLLGIAAWGDVVLGWASVHRYVRDPWYILALVVGLAVLAQWPRPRLRWRMGAASLGFLSAGIWLGVLSYHPRAGLEVVFFDVGHGDAALVRFPNGRYLLIDAGGRDAYVDHGRRTVLPHLERFDIDRLDAVVISHPHADHLGGLPALLRSVTVQRVLHNGQPGTTALYAETAHLLDSLSVSHQAVHVGDTLLLDPSVLIQVFAPDSVQAFDEANEASVVFRLVYGETAFLFTGDAETGAEQSIVNRFGRLLPSDVVKVAHHGSRTSSTPTFVDHASADTSRSLIAVVSVGSRARFDLPDEEVLARWHARGADVWTTVRRGALWLRSDGQKVDTIEWR